MKSSALKPGSNPFVEKDFRNERKKYIYSDSYTVQCLVFSIYKCSSLDELNVELIWS